MERLPVVGDLLSDQGLAGPRLRAVRLNNAALEAVREQEDPLCSLLAETRWLTYQLGRKEYGRRVGIDTHAVQNSETTGTRVEHETHSAILRRWTKDEIAAETRRHLLELLILRARARPEEAQ